MSSTSRNARHARLTPARIIPLLLLIFSLAAFLSCNSSLEPEEPETPAQETTDDNGTNSGAPTTPDGTEQLSAWIYCYPKLLYYIGDTFTLEDLQIGLYDTDNSVIYITYPDSRITASAAPDMSQKGEYQISVTVTYGSRTATLTFTVQVIDEPDRSLGYTLSFTTLPKTAYLVGEDFSLVDAELAITGTEEGTVYIRLDSENTISFYETYYGLTCTGYDTAQEGTQTVVLSIAYPFWTDGTYIDNYAHSQDDGYQRVEPVLKAAYGITVLAEQSAYVVTYTGKDTQFDAGQASGALVRISVPESVGELDILDLYGLRKRIVAAGAAKVVYDDIPQSVVYRLDVPERDGYEWKFDVMQRYVSSNNTQSKYNDKMSYSQFDVIIEYFIDIARELNLSSTLYYLDKRNEDNFFILPTFVSELYANPEYRECFSWTRGEGSFYNSSSDALLVLEFVPGINFVAAYGGAVDTWTCAIQVKENRTLTVSGNICIIYWPDYDEDKESCGARSAGYHPDFHPLFWLKDGAHLRIDDWSRIRILANDKYEKFFYADLDLLGFNPEMLTAAQLPQIRMGTFVPKGFNGTYEELVASPEYAGHKSDVLSTGMDVHWCVNASRVGRIIARYHELGSLDKIDITAGSVAQRGYDGNVAMTYPCMYIGNEPNPSRPKLPLKLAQWYIAHGFTHFHNVCITDDGTALDPSVWDHLSSLTNVRFEVDMNGVSFTGLLTGVVEFLQPGDLTEYSSADKIVISGLGSKESVEVLYAKEIDVSYFDSSNIGKITLNGANAVRFKDETASKAVVSKDYIKYKVYDSVNQDKMYTNQDWEEAANNGTNSSLRVN